VEIIGTIISVILLVIALIFVSIIFSVLQNLFHHLSKKNRQPSQIAKVLGPILILVSFLEVMLPIITIPIMFTKLKMGNSDYKEIGLFFIICLFCSIIGGNLSFDYYRHFYLIPKNNAESENETEQITSQPTEEKEQFKPRYF
jgi:hypothetical protein